MTPYPDLQVRFQLQKGQSEDFKVLISMPRVLGLFFLPHYSVGDLSPGTNAAAQHRQQKPWATILPLKLLSHSGIEIWLLDGKQKTLVLTTTPKSASAALGTFPRVSRTGSQQAELFGGNSTSYLTPLFDYYRDTGMVRASSHPPWGQCLVSCSNRLVKKSLLGVNQWQRRIRQLCPKFSTGPEWKFHTRNRNLPVKHCNKFKQTNNKKICFSCRCSEVFRAFTRQEWRKETGLGRAFLSKLPNNFALQPCPALGSLPMESMNSLAQNSAVERTCYSSWFKCRQQLGKTALYCSDTEKMQKKGINPRVIPGLRHMSTERALNHPFVRGKPKPHTKTGNSGPGWRICSTEGG